MIPAAAPDPALRLQKAPTSPTTPAPSLTPTIDDVTWKPHEQRAMEQRGPNGQRYGSHTWISNADGRPKLWAAARAKTKTIIGGVCNASTQNTITEESKIPITCNNSSQDTTQKTRHTTQETKHTTAHAHSQMDSAANGTTTSNSPSCSRMGNNRQGQSLIHMLLLWQAWPRSAVPSHIAQPGTIASAASQPTEVQPRTQVHWPNQDWVEKQISVFRPVVGTTKTGPPLTGSSNSLTDIYSSQPKARTQNIEGLGGALQSPLPPNQQDDPGMVPDPHFAAMVRKDPSTMVKPDWWQGWEQPWLLCCKSHMASHLISNWKSMLATYSFSHRAAICGFPDKNPFSAYIHLQAWFFHILAKWLPMHVGYWASNSEVFVEWNWKRRQSIAFTYLENNDSYKCSDYHCICRFGSKVWMNVSIH